MDMLTVEDINVYYGAIHAIKGISLSVAKGGITTLIGSNGAGKSTTLHTISGLLKPKTGKITFEGQDITGKPAHKIVGMGLSQVPEGRHVFANMTVLENLELGAYLRRDKEEINKDLTDVFTKFPRLLERKDQIPVRRRTADAGYGPGADEPSPADAAGRTVHGSGASAGTGNF